MAPEKILIDTSAWILSFKKAGDPRLKEFLKQAIISGGLQTKYFKIKT